MDARMLLFGKCSGMHGGEALQCARAATCQIEFAQCTYLCCSVYSILASSWASSDISLDIDRTRSRPSKEVQVNQGTFDNATAMCSFNYAALHNTMLNTDICTEVYIALY